MKRLTTVAVVSFLAALMAPAFAGERYLGAITVSDAGWTANFTTQDSGFPIPPGAKLSIQPTGHAYVCVDSHVNNAGAIVCNSTQGVLVPAGVLFATSCSKASRSFIVPELASPGDGGPSVQWDGGARTVPTCSVACIAMDAGTVSCPVWERTGDEI